MTSLETYAGLLRTYISNPNTMLEPIIDLCIEDEDTVREQIWRHIRHSRNNLKPCVNQWHVFGGKEYIGMNAHKEEVTFYVCPNATEIKTHGYNQIQQYCDHCKLKQDTYEQMITLIESLFKDDDTFREIFEYERYPDNLEYVAFKEVISRIWDTDLSVLLANLDEVPPNVPELGPDYYGRM